MRKFKDRNPVKSISKLQISISRYFIVEILEFWNLITSIRTSQEECVLDIGQNYNESKSCLFEAP